MARNKKSMATPDVSEKSSAPIASTPRTGSAAASADKWAEEGRQSLRKANDAISKGNFGTADAYRQSASLAFANELELRKQWNADLRQDAGSGRGA